jgi:uncharacterized DUF497 family protein
MDDTVIMPGFEGFDWDEATVSENWRTHHVSPIEAEQVLFNRPLLAADDPKHSQGEKRHYVLGRTNQGRMLFIAFTVRGATIRVISARDMSRKGRKMYRQL